jgi:hypothetical protein
MSGSRYHYNDSTGQPKSGPNSKPPANVVHHVHRMKYAERVRGLRLVEEKTEGCSLEKLNAILWPSGKRMPRRR